MVFDSLRCVVGGSLAAGGTGHRTTGGDTVTNVLAPQVDWEGPYILQLKAELAARRAEIDKLRAHVNARA